MDQSFKYCFVLYRTTSSFLLFIEMYVINAFSPSFRLECPEIKGKTEQNTAQNPQLAPERIKSCQEVHVLMQMNGYVD